MCDSFLCNMWQHFFMFLGLKNRFLVSLHSKPLHGLELISFSMILDNRCCHGNTFCLFLGCEYKKS